MAGKPDPKTRAARLRRRISKADAPARSGGPVTTPSEPRPGESPNAYVDRRMRDTLKKPKP